MHFEEYIFATSAVRGQEVKVPYPLPFSFFFSPGVGVQSCIRVQPVFNPKRLLMSETGFLQLCDDWTFIPELDYHTLEGVHNGGEASAAFADLPNHTPEENAETRKNLLTYCGLDSLAMVKVLEKLRECVQ